MSPSSAPGRLPCAVQVGFAGSRRPLPDDCSDLPDQLERQLTERLTEHLSALPGRLGLEPHLFLCGLSQIAAGADVAFTRACRTLAIPQRILLPQPADAYLSALGSDGTPDFTDAERRSALDLLDGPQIVEQRVVTDAATRQQRFAETNRELAAQSDVVVCLIRQGSAAKPGGTAQLLDLARQRQIPALELEVSVQEGQVQLQATEHGYAGFAAPALPSPLDRTTAPGFGNADPLPEVQAYVAAVKAHCSGEAAKSRQRFGRAAWIVIGTHLLATLGATVVLAGHGLGGDGHHGHATWPLVVLLVELLALGIGFGTHHWMHHAAPSRNWAQWRLLAEICRSVRALGDLHLPLDYLFRLRLPDGLVPLLRTLNILHLRSTRAQRERPWRAALAGYLNARLRDPDPETGQIAYYRDRCRRERTKLKASQWIFTLCSLLAILATGLKLLTLVGVVPVDEEPAALLTAILGTLAVFLPVLAVGALSWAAAQDYVARVHSFGTTLRFLERRSAELDHILREPDEPPAGGLGDLRDARRAIETIELALLGETLEWSMRRTFGSVA